MNLHKIKDPESKKKKKKKKKERKMKEEDGESTNQMGLPRRSEQSKR